MTCLPVVEGLTTIAGGASVRRDISYLVESMALRHAAMLEVNEYLVLDFIREHERTTRPEIGRALGLSASSVSRMVSRLQRAGIVEELPGTSSAAGRPRNVIAFNHRAGTVIAIDLGGTQCRGALTDLAGSILVEEVRANVGQGGAFGALVGTIEFLRQAAATREVPLRALAVGIPAILDPTTGVAMGGPNVDWQGFEIVGRLRELLDVPFLVDNDANLAALAHAWRGDGQDVSHFVAVTIGTGIGAAVVADGELVKGHHNAAGEIGYLVMGREQLHQPLNGGIGGFEAVASGPAIVQRASELVARAVDGRTAAHADGLEPVSQAAPGAASAVAGPDITVEHVFAAAAAGDPVFGQVVDEVVDWVALALVNVVATVDPELIVLEGRVGRSLEPFLGEIARRMAGRLPVMPRLSVSRLGPKATMLGAIAAALQLAHRQSAPSALFRAFDIGQRVSS
jgi:glucokinase